MKDDEEGGPSPESLAKLAKFARRVLSVPKVKVDQKLREERKQGGRSRSAKGRRP